MKQQLKQHIALILIFATIASLLTAIPATAATEEENNVLSDPWKVIAEDFDKTDGYTFAANGAITTPVIQCDWSDKMSETLIAKDPDNSENKVLQLIPTAGAKYRILPKDAAFTSKDLTSFTLSFDFYFASENTKGYNGFSLGNNGDANHVFRIWNGGIVTDSYHSCEGATSNQAKEDIIDAKTWYTAKFVRSDSSVTLQICKKNTPDTFIYNETKDYTCNAVDTTSAILLAPGSNLETADASVYFDNYRLENIASGLSCVAAQTSDVTDGKYAVRFIGTVDSEQYTKVGFHVVASYEENGEEKHRKFVLEDCTVYTSILASYGNAVYTAADLGGKYLIALSIYDIPASYGSIVFDVKATGVAVDENGGTSPVESKPVSITVNKLFVTPQMFGAVGDGVTDDTAAIQKAVQNAAANRTLLKLPEAEYYTTEPIDLDNINVQSENAKILFYGKQASVPAVDMHSNVSITGKLRIWTVDNTDVTQNHGGRSGIAFGNYNSGEGARNCYVEELEISGGVYNGNGVFITGDSSDITIDRITVIGNNHLAIATLIHWGNSDDHYPEYIDGEKTGNYLHAENADYTKHPHDIHIGQVNCHDLLNSGDGSAVYLSAAYNVTIDEIIADNIRTVMMVTGGDCGFAFAKPAEQIGGSKNVVVNKITATNVQHGGFYYVTDSSYQGIPHVYGELELGEVSITYAEGSNAGPYFDGISKLTVGQMTLKNIKKPTFYFINDCKNVSFQTLTLENCSASASDLFRIERRGEYATADVGIDGLLVQNLILKNSTYHSIFSVCATAKNVHLENLTLTGSSISGAIYYAREAVPARNNLTVGKSDYGVTIQAGESCTVVVRAYDPMAGMGETVSWNSTSAISK